MQTRLFASAFVLFLALAAAPSGARATLLEYWDFNNVSAPFNSPFIGKFGTTSNGSGEAFNASNQTMTSNSANGAVFTNGLLDLTGLNIAHQNDGSNTATPPAYGAYTDSTVNRLGTDTSTGGSLLITNTPNNVDSLVFTLSTTGYTSLTLSSAQRFSFSSLTGISTTWSYSTDDSTWTSLTQTGTAGTNSTFSTISLSLPSTLSNLSTLYVKETITFASSDGSFALDNVQLNGIAAVPEPSTYAFLAVGAGALLWRLRRLRASGIAC